MASDHLGVNLSSGQIEYVLDKLYNERTGRGLLVHHKMAEAQQEVEACRYRADEFFDAIAEWLEDQRQARRCASSRRNSSPTRSARRW